MNSKTLSFCSFNLLNLNKPGLKLYKNTAPWTEAEYERKIDFTQRMLRVMAADVYGFQELWHAESLRDCLAAAQLDDDYEALVPVGHDGKRIVCAAAVRRDLLDGEPEWIERFEEPMKLASKGDDPQSGTISVGLKKFSRPVLHLRIKPHADHPSIHVFVCHFKSKSPTRIDQEEWFDRATHGPHAVAIGAALSTIRRTAEACALRIIITKATKRRRDPVVVIGDVNDGVLSNTHNILTEQPNYLIGLSKGGSDTALYAAQTLQDYRSTRDVIYTHVYKNERESLDHILFSEEFYDNSRKRIWSFEGLDVSNDHLNDDAHRANGSNDHGVVRARFKLSPARPANG